MDKYRKKKDHNKEVEAAIWDGVNKEKIAKEFPDILDQVISIKGYFILKQPEGIIRVSPNEYVVKGEYGELYPMEKARFESEYELKKPKKETK